MPVGWLSIFYPMNHEWVIVRDFVKRVSNISRLSLFLFVSECNRPYIYHVCYGCKYVNKYVLCICAELVKLWALYIDCYTCIAPAIHFYILFLIFHTFTKRVSKGATVQDKLQLTASHGLKGSFHNTNIIIIFIINNSTNNHYYHYH